MKVFVAGASGTIGRPLVRHLVAGGHEVVGTTRTEQGAGAVRDLGATPAVLDAFDSAAVRQAILAAAPEVIVHQLTSLPKEVHGAHAQKAMKESAPVNAALRRDTLPVFASAAAEAGARRLVVQSIAFVTPPSGADVHDEDTPLWLDCPDPGMRQNVEAVRDMEASTLDAAVEGVVLRYGFFYGPGTWYAPDGSFGQLIRRRQLPIIGSGAGRMSLVHVDDAVAATVLALERGAPGVYNVCGDAARWADWVPETARLLGAKRPWRVPAWLGRRVAGPTAAHYATTIRPNDASRAREAFGWTPRPWREGFAEVFGGA